MMSQAEQYPFLQMDPAAGAVSLLPYLPLTLTFRSRSLSVNGLLDTGATIKVLPYDVGVQLGAVWEEQTTPVQLTGNLAQAEARALIVTAAVGKFLPVRLAFAWTQERRVPVILGQVNFVMEFDACFFRCRCLFEVKPKQ